MIRSVEGVFRDGKIELTEPAPPGASGPVIVTFLAPAGSADLAARGITEAEARDLRRRLAPFAEDWDRPEMDVYDAL
jgi:hypothetical protein